LTFSRYAGPGSHRYPVGFSGDSIVTWASLDFQPEFTATASNIGYGWWSHDIGGHMGGVKDDELGTRWVQFGVFSPVMRLHASNNQWTAKGPWKFGIEAKNVIINFLRLRHWLLPYLYTMNAKAALEGTQIVQPMYWDYPNRDCHVEWLSEGWYICHNKQMQLWHVTFATEMKHIVCRTSTFLGPN
jgi:alpha-glucosidase (family GH31 glycosyl hydrolase)